MCLLLILSAISPRLTLAVTYFFTGFISRGVPSYTLWWALVGFFFAPLSLLWYCAIENWYGGAWNWWQIAVMVLFLLTDLSSDKAGSKRSAKRRG